MGRALTGNFCCIVAAVAMAVATMGPQLGLAQDAAGDSSTGFPPLDRWKNAILADDATSLKALYSLDSAEQGQGGGATNGLDADINFWLSMKARSMKLEIVRLKERPGAESVIFKAEAETSLPNSQNMNVTEAQGWRKQGEQWRIVAVERTAAPHLNQPSDMKKNIYPADADARAEIKEAEEKAAARHKRVLLVFGANWCYDCHVLDLAFHRPDFAPTMDGYEAVHVDIGDDGKKNADLARQFDVPLDKGVPALAVVEADGRVVVSQKNGEFENARALSPQALLQFLDKWKPASR